MIEQVTISIPQSLYRRARALARVRNQSVDAVLETGVALVEAASILPADEVEVMTQEEAAYELLHPELMAYYAGEFVAVYQGQLIDHDQDETALLRRLDAHYPNEVVLMKQVRPLPEPELHFRSPRFVTNGA
jgi:hypothetical protein